MIYFMIATGPFNSQDMIRILKQSRHDFSDKHLCDGYFMDINRGSYGFVRLLEEFVT